MGLETGSFIDSLVETNPENDDDRHEGDDHLRLIKTVLKTTFPGMAGRAWRVQSKSGAYTAVLNDNMTVLAFTADATLALTAAGTLGNGWMCIVVPDGAGVDITVDPNSTEQINGATTYVAPKHDATLILCNASKFYALSLGAVALAAITAPALDDVLKIEDTSAVGRATITLLNLFKVLGLLTTEASIAVAADFLPFYDTSATEPRKLTPEQLVTALGATAAEQEAGTLGTRIVTPEIQHRHPSAAKYWVRFDGATGAIESSHNVSSVVKDGTGEFTVTLIGALSAATHNCPVGTAQQAGALRTVTLGTTAAGTIEVKIWNSAGALADATRVMLIGFGDR